jgi:hypothetical protein
MGAVDSKVYANRSTKFFLNTSDGVGREKIETRSIARARRHSWDPGGTGPSAEGAPAPTRDSSHLILKILTILSPLCICDGLYIVQRVYRGDGMG